MWRLFLIHRRQSYHTLALDNRVYGQAARLSFTHPLRGYDAVQLACTLHARRLLVAVTSDVRLCTADQRLAAAATAEGLKVEFII
jgi:predicted nucleic acid-binding protein